MAVLHGPLLTLGPYFDIPVTADFDIGIKTGIGFALTNIESFDVSVYQDPNQVPVIYNIDFNASPAFTYLLGVNGEVRLSAVIGLIAFVDFSAARSKVESFVGAIGRTQSYYDLSFINTGIGIVVNFD